MKMCPVKPSPWSELRSALPLLFLCLGLLAAPAQLAAPKIARITISHVGPATVSEELVRSNIRARVGEPFVLAAIDEDVKSLYATGLFYNIRIAREETTDGIVVTYLVQAKPRLTEIKFTGNKKYKPAKLLKKCSSKVGDPLDERKLFTDSQEIEKMYQKSGYPGTKVKYVLNIEESTGRGTATFEINETRKMRIERVDFIGATAFTQRELRKVIKTRDHWMFSWLTGSGVFKEDQFEEDRERLIEFYRSRGFIDFEIKDVVFDPLTPKRIIIKIHVFEGAPYKVGSVSFKGATMFPTNEVDKRLELKPGATFTPGGLSRDIGRVEDFYGSKGHIDVTPSSGNLRVVKVPNVEKGTMDLAYQVEEGQKSYVEKVEIRGNVKTKDRVIRRELAVAPGETFDMVRVKLSEQRLQGLQYFEKVDARPEATEIPNRKNLIIGVEERNTGNVSLGAGFSSVDAIVGYVEFTQGNFDLGNPPYFTGGGQKLRLRVQIGSERQDYILSFVEPWFLGRKLALGVDFYHRELSYQSFESLYDETRTGAKVGLTRTLGSDFLIGTVSYTLENVGIINVSTAAPPAIVSEEGNSLLSRVGTSIAYDTRNSVTLPDRGQRTEIFTEVTGGPLGGDESFYKLEVKSSWYFKGIARGHVLEIAGRTGVADGLSSSDDVPFYDRYYLGGLYSMRGYEYREIGPREPLNDGSGRSEPVGGNTYWFGTAEYSIPLVERVRFAMFYDIGNVLSDAYDYDFSDYADNWGVGIRLNLPIGPLRLDYGVPISYPDYADGGGRFQFGVGYTRDF